MEPETPAHHLFGDEDARGARLRLFEGCGVELEYMLVDRATLDVLPIADRVLADGSGASAPVNDWVRG